MELTYEYLLEENQTSFSKEVVGENNEILTYYLDSKLGYQYIDRYYTNSSGYIHNQNAILISSNGNTPFHGEFIRYIFNKLDPIIDLDFQEMSHNNGSKLDIYPISYASNFSSTTVGMAIGQEVQGGKWYDILYLTKNQSSLTSFDKNTIVHEIAHALGLSHPNGDPFDIRWTSNDTIMSYNKGTENWNTWFSDEDLYGLKKIWGRENDDGIMTFTKQSKEYKFFKSVDNTYLIETTIGKENITGIDKLIFSDKTLNMKEDIIDVFEQVVGIDDITGKIFRLYNTSFGRFPDYDGLNYWIKMNKSGENNYRQTCSSFILSEEFITKYGDLISNSEYVNALYTNIFERNADKDGFQYWLGQLNEGIETRGEVLMGFSESIENKGIFSEMLNIY